MQSFCSCLWMIGPVGEGQKLPLSFGYWFTFSGSFASIFHQNREFVFFLLNGYYLISTFTLTSLSPLFLLQYWELKPGGTLPLSAIHPLALFNFWVRDSLNCPGWSWPCDLPISASQGARVTGMHQHTWLHLFFPPIYWCKWIFFLLMVKNFCHQLLGRVRSP